ncbi:MAG TPA: tol-pal system protein YbgF [Caulobacteraceae bacterium]|nr:tol-pal system protein YbgF [Caulobacteraceae bacterium]
MPARTYMQKAPALAGAFLAVVLAVAAPAMAQVPLDPLDDHSAKRLDRMEQALKEIRAIVFQGRETGKPVVVEPADTDSELTALTQKIDDLQQAVTHLTGQLESAAHDVDEAHREADALREENGALTARVAALEQKAAQAAPPTVAVVPPDATPPVPTDPAATMAAAREAYNAGDLAAAETGFRNVADHYGATPRGLEAKYFLGKIMLKREAFADAAAMDLGVVRQWPATAWAPDAALDLARAMVGMKETREACGVLTEIDGHYPKASAAVRAGEVDVKGQAGCAAG